MPFGGTEQGQRLSEEQLEFADRQILLTQTQLPRSSWSSVTLAHFPKHCTCNHFFTLR